MVAHGGSVELANLASSIQRVYYLVIISLGRRNRDACVQCARSLCELLCWHLCKGYHAFTEGPSDK